MVQRWAKRRTIWDIRSSTRQSGSGGRETPDAWSAQSAGLFDDDAALPLEAEDIAELSRAASLDWAEIDPSIMGTLFERGLNPNKRSQFGAH